MQSIGDTRTLNDGQRIPVLGFGLYLSPPEQTEASCSTALKAGYRLLDTGVWYENGAQAADAIKKSGLQRDQVFFQTKHLADSNDPDLLATCRKIVKETGLDHVDAFLIHSPACGPETRRRYWKALEELKEEGLTKSIGVCNFGAAHLKEMKDYARVPPCLNQIELHPLMLQEDIVEYCKSEGIALQAFCPLMRGERMSDPVIARIAKDVDRDPGQVLLRWSLQRGFMPLPKSDNPKRIVSNADLFGFELSEAQMDDITELGKKERHALAPDNTRCP